MAKRTWFFRFEMDEPDQDYRWVDVLPPLRPGSSTERILPYGIRLRVEVDREYRLVCTGMQLGDPPAQWSDEASDRWNYQDGDKRLEVTTRELHEIRINEILTQLASIAANLESDWLLDALRIRRPPGAGPSRRIDARPVGRRGHPRELYQEVAELYRTSGMRKPVKRIAEHFVIADATARRYVRRARELGFLGEAIPSKAGERPIKDRKETDR